MPEGVKPDAKTEPKKPAKTKAASPYTADCFDIETTRKRVRLKDGRWGEQVIRTAKLNDKGKEAKAKELGGPKPAG